MMQPHFNVKPLVAALVITGMLSGCGGGSDDKTTSNASGGTQTGNTNTSSGGTNGGNSSGNTSSGGTQTSQGPTVMSCPDGANYQCSGENIVKAGEVALTDFGVQAYGKATSDLGKTVFTPDEAPNATGLLPDAGGITEVRLAKNSSGAVTRVALVLKNLGLPWDGKAERPPIIETFDPTQGRVAFGANNAIVAEQFHDSSDWAFYDYATKTTAGTQSHYANNRYFPRNTPSRCGTSVFTTPCPSSDPTKETDGKLNYQEGNWRTAGGKLPDTVSLLRFHEDGDIHAGNAVDGSPLPGGSGAGVPFPGSKGYRTYNGLSYQYVNLGAWFSADTVWIAEWTAQDGRREHSTNRRGVVAFGAVTNPSLIPTTGGATYSGRIYGRYASAKDADPVAVEGDATIDVDFAKRQATIKILPEGSSAAITFTSLASFDAAGTNAMSGTVDNGRLTGRVSTRFFGPLSTTGNQGPAETGGAFSMKNATTGESVVGGFIARKQ